MSLDVAGEKSFKIHFEISQKSDVCVVNDFTLVRLTSVKFLNG